MMAADDGHGCRDVMGRHTLKRPAPFFESPSNRSQRMDQDGSSRLGIDGMFQRRTMNVAM